MSTRVETQAKIKVYEIDDKKVPVLSGFVLCCATHWQDQDMVVLTTPGDAGGKPVTILAADLIKAIQRCSR